MEKLLIVCCVLGCLRSVQSQEDCTVEFGGITATCSPNIPLTVIPDDLPVDTLRTLILKNNEIATLFPGNISYYQLLEELDLSSNLITNIPANLSSGSLQELILDNNPIALIDDNAFESFPAITTLSLKDTYITTLDSNTLIGMDTLSVLFLQDSKLLSLAGDTFEHTKFIDKLDIRRNEIQTLPEGIFDGLFNLDEISLSENPWSCDCRMEWFRNYLTDNSDKIDDINSLRCQYPYYDVLMTDLLAEDFSCSEPMIITQPSNDSIVTNMTYTLKLEVNGAPFPNVTWYKDDKPLIYNNNVYLDIYNASLYFVNILVVHNGVYYAEITNDYGSVNSDAATLIVTEVTCFNDVKDGFETDIDCGGIFCKECDKKQDCLIDSDCAGDLVCLYNYQLSSKLHYISPNSIMAYICDNASIAEELLNTRLQNGLQSTELFGTNFTVETDITDVQNSMKQILSNMLTVNEMYITDVEVTTVERPSIESVPLIQIWFNLVKNSDGRTARNTLLQLIDKGEISGTFRITEEQLYFNIRLNL